jgi:myo-inositol-1(or 4)-monophosphatase
MHCAAADQEKLMLLMRATANEAGEAVRRIYAADTLRTERKQGAEIVTQGDLEADRLIRERLANAIPGAVFLTEEGDRAVETHGWTWIVDPVDGTSNYAHGHPYFCVSIALALDGKVQLGVVHAPALGETYCASRGGGAYLNGQRILVSNTRELSAAIVSTGLPHDRTQLEWPIERFRRIAISCRDLRRSGSPALDICYVACGRLDAHVESLAPWDIAAAGLIAVEAGAVRGNLSIETGKMLAADLRGEHFIVATPHIFSALSILLQISEFAPG